MRFVKEYLRDQNATRAMVRAGYSARTANNHCSRLMADPEIKRMIKAGLADQESAMRLANVNLLLARIDEARTEILTARDEIRDAGRRVKKATETVMDIERLTTPTAVTAPHSAPAAPSLSAGPDPRPATAMPAPILPRQTAPSGDWSRPAYPERLAFTETHYDPLG